MLVAPFDEDFQGAPLLRQFTADMADPDQIRAMLENPATLLMPLLEGKNLFHGDKFQPVLVRKARFPTLAEGARSVTLLGAVEETPVFGVDLDPDSAPKGLDKLGEFKNLREALPHIDPEDAQLLGLARCLAHWHRTNGFCSACGGPSESVHAGHARVCVSPDCAREIYPGADPAVIVLAVNNDRCLLGSQAGWPDKLYSAIAGFVEPCETLESAARRELAEETGIRAETLTYFGSQPWPFPASLMAAFLAETSDQDASPLDGELRDVRWFTRQEIVQALESGEIRLPMHRSVSFKIIEHWFDSAWDRPLATLIK